MFIYLGVAAIIGLITGSVLHLSSSLLVSVFNLTATSEETGRSAASVRAAHEQKKLEQAWDRIPTNNEKGASLLVSVFNLTATSEETGRSAASVRAAHEQKKLEQAWDRIPTNNEKGDLRSDPEMEKFAEWLEKGDQGVLGQTILEEDDSDDLDGF